MHKQKNTQIGNVEVLYKLTHSDARPPSYASSGAAGMDLHSVDNILIAPNQFVVVSTGVILELPMGWEAQVRPRSGLASRHGVTVLNAPGTIDCDYRGDIKVILINHGRLPFLVETGARIAQLVIAQAPQVLLRCVGEMSPSARGINGFGSTGAN